VVNTKLKGTLDPPLQSRGIVPVTLTVTCFPGERVCLLGVMEVMLVDPVKVKVISLEPVGQVLVSSYSM
jgi:hypothetical protein